MHSFSVSELRTGRTQKCCKVLLVSILIQAQTTSHPSESFSITHCLSLPSSSCPGILASGHNQETWDARCPFVQHAGGRWSLLSIACISVLALFFQLPLRTWQSRLKSKSRHLCRSMSICNHCVIWVVNTTCTQRYEAAMTRVNADEPGNYSTHPGTHTQTLARTPPPHKSTEVRADFAVARG